MSNNLIFGNAFQELKKIESNSIHLIVTDPPYLINYKEWDNGDFKKFTEDWIKECVRVLKDNGTMWSFMGYQNVFDFVPLLNKYGICHLENWVIWARAKGRGSSKHLKSVREDIFHFTKTDKFVWNNLKVLRDVVIPYIKDGKPRGWFLDEDGHKKRWTGLGNVWVYTSPFWKSLDDKQVHPAQKPNMLIERLIRLSSNEGDVVLDPFMGSGTTGIACKNSNRSFIGIENNKEYFDIAKERIER